MALADQGNPNALAAVRLLKNTSRFLATIQVGITLAGFFASAEGAVSFVDPVSEAFAASEISFFRDYRDTFAIVLVTLPISFLNIIIGELVPKNLGIRFAEPIALAVARPLVWLSVAISPLITLLSATSDLVLRLMGQGKAMSEQRPVVTEADLRMMFDVATTEGDVEEREAEMLHRVFQFTDRLAHEVMTPRPEIEWLDKDDTIADFLPQFAESYHTRYVLCDGDADHVAGILYTKDVLRAIATEGVSNDVPLIRFLQPAFFVPETKRVGAMFDEMRTTGQEMAIVVDEYGGTAGLVTLKQLIEEIVGRVGDDLLGQEAEFKEIDEHTFEVDGSMRVDEANEILHLELPDGDYETVAGFVLDALGRIPREGEQVRHNDLRIVVKEMSGVKIEKVQVTRA